jgi:F-type H+-transporting ATPase subunit gamma
MADTKQLKIKIAATKNIKKITNALEIISTLKLQKVKKKADHLREYVATILEIVDLMLQKWIVLYDKGDVSSDRELLLVVSSEKWLCWSLNSQLFKFLHQQYADKKSVVDFYVIGKKAYEFFSRQGYNIVGYTQVSDAIHDDELADVFTYINEQEQEQVYWSISIAYNYFKNTMKQIPLVFPIKPFTPEILDDFLETVGMVRKQKRSRIHDFVLEPDVNTVHDTLKNMVIDYSLYAALLHNKTGEFAARMLAMKWAKDNASVIIDDVTLRYNKARQDAITQEVSEIVSAKSVIEG